MTDQGKGDSNGESLSPQRQLSAELDQVMRTCRVTAAMRAVEMARADKPIIVDRLAAVLAGHDAKQRFEPYYDQFVAEGGEGKHLYFPGRARILDDRILEMLHDMGADAQTSPVQIVSLGCGVDTRPWRLNTFPGIRWFDVDQAPVITIKQQLLQEAGAALGHSATGGAAAGSAADGSKHGNTGKGDGAAPANGEQEGAGSENGHGACRFPLVVDSYVMVAADLADAGWTRKLEEAGFDAGVRTIWVAEGVLYYLPPDANAALLEAAARLSAPGSRMLCTAIPVENLEANQTCPEYFNFRGAFKASVDDIVASGAMARAGWHNITVSPDLSVVLEHKYGMKAYYAYTLAYAHGKRLQEVEFVVEAVKP